MSAETTNQPTGMFFVDQETHEPCPTAGRLLCTITDPNHLHVAGHMVKADRPVPVADPTTGETR